MVYKPASQRLSTKQYELWQMLISLSDRGTQLPADFQAFIRPRIDQAHTMERFHNLLAIWAGNQDDPEAIIARLR